MPAASASAMMPPVDVPVIMSKWLAIDCPSKKRRSISAR
jgi:hypothetical protein